VTKRNVTEKRAASDTRGHTLPGEPKGEWVPDNDDEPDGFLGASLVFWDMKREEEVL